MDNEQVNQALDNALIQIWESASYKNSVLAANVSAKENIDAAYPTDDKK